jgi:hypothetical protein
MIIKLIPGQKINLTVSAVEEVEGNYGPQYKFSGSTPDDANATLYLNVDTALKQLQRAGYANVDAVVNTTLEVERVEKNGTKYTNLSRVNGAAKQSNAKQPYSSGAPLPWEDGAPEPTTTTVSKLDALLNLYHTIEDNILSVSAKKFATSGVGASPESIAAQIATVFIAAKDRGLAA